MQFALSFLLLLVCVLSAVKGAPTQPGPGLVTLSLTRVHQTIPNGIHPQVFLQQNINRSLKRHAKMTGRDAPSRAHLEKRIFERMVDIDASFAKRSRAKRYNRHGLPSPHPSLNPQFAKAKAFHAKESLNTAVNTSSFAEQVPGGFSETDLAALLDSDLTKANTPTTPNSLGLDIEGNDVGYVATVQFGTPPRDFRLIMDSGSADLWVGSEGCVSENGGDCGNHVFLGPQSSASFVNTTTPFQVTYGSGAVSGSIVTDNINLAGLQLDTHTFGVATTESEEFTGDLVSFDGLMGLAQSTLSNQRTLTPVEALAQKGLIPEAITSYKISRLSDGKNDGQVTFGGLDSTKFDPATQVTIANVNDIGFWEAPMTAVTVNGQDLGLQGRTAILDTGTTLILAPPADAEAFHNAIPGARSDGRGGFIIPCTTTASVSLTFGDRAFDIKTEDLLFAPVDANDLAGDCISGITSGTIKGDTVWLVGDVFLKNAYFSTDVGRNQITLAGLV